MENTHTLETLDDVRRRVREVGPEMELEITRLGNFEAAVAALFILPLLEEFERPDGFLSSDHMLGIPVAIDPVLIGEEDEAIRTSSPEHRNFLRVIDVGMERVVVLSRVGVDEVTKLTLAASVKSIVYLGLARGYILSAHIAERPNF